MNDKTKKIKNVRIAAPTSNDTAKESISSIDKNSLLQEFSLFDIEKLTIHIYITN